MRVISKKKLIPPGPRVLGPGPYLSRKPKEQKPVKPTRADKTNMINALKALHSQFDNLTSGVDEASDARLPFHRDTVKHMTQDDVEEFYLAVDTLKVDVDDLIRQIERFKKNFNTFLPAEE